MKTQTKIASVAAIRSALAHGGIPTLADETSIQREGVRLTQALRAVRAAFDIRISTQRAELIKKSISVLEAAGYQVQGNPYDPNSLTITS